MYFTYFKQSNLNILEYYFIKKIKKKVIQNTNRQVSRNTRILSRYEWKLLFWQDTRPVPVDALNVTVFYSYLLSVYQLMLLNKCGPGFLNSFIVRMFIFTGSRGALSSNDVRMFVASQLSCGTIPTSTFFFGWRILV